MNTDTDTDTDTDNRDTGLISRKMFATSVRETYASARLPKEFNGC